MILVFVATGAIFNEVTGEAFSAIQSTIVTTFGWFYVAAVTLFLGFVLFLMVSRFGRKRARPRTIATSHG